MQQGFKIYIHCLDSKKFMKIFLIDWITETSKAYI